MTEVPWRSSTTENIASQYDTRYETPGGAQNKVDLSQEYLLHLLKLAVTGLSDGSEAAIARYSDPYNITYDWLKDRLDAADLRDINQKSFNVRDFGATGTGSTNDYASILSAITTIGSLQCQLSFPLGTYKISSNLTIPSNIDVVIPNGSSLLPDSGVTVTINGFINAGEYSIFKGAGTITGTFKNRMVYVKWFNMDESANTDVSASLQNVVNICQQSNAVMSFPKGLKYRVDTQIVFDYGKGSALGMTKEIYVNGNQSMIYPNIDGPAFLINPLCLKADAASGWGISFMNMQDLVFDNYFGNLNGHTNCQAIQVGKDGYQMDGFQRSRLTNVLCVNFKKSAIEITNARFIDIDKISIRGGPGLKLSTYTAGSFCGDINVSNSDFITPTGYKTLELYGYAPTGVYGDIRGVHFQNCVFYGSDTSLEASTHMQIGDVWFSNCAWDVGVDAIAINATGDSHIFNIYFDNPYITNYSGHGIKSQTDGTATAKNLKIIGGNIDVTGTSPGIDLISNEEFQIIAVTFSGGSGDNTVSCSFCTRVMVQNCLSRDTSKTYFVSIGNSTDFAITGNMSTKPINDYSGSVNKLVANNLVIT